TDMIQDPILHPDELEREKGVIVEELNMYKDIPWAEIDNILESTMCPGQALGRDIVGSKATVTKLTPQMFRSYMERHYQPSNIILGVSGKFDPRQLDFLIKKYCKNLPKRRTHKWSKVKDGQKQARIKVKYKES